MDVQLRSGQLELRFEGRFTPADLELLKAMHGRRWDRQRRVWLLPHTPQVVDALRRSFGLRHTVPDARPACHPAQPSRPVEQAASPSHPGDESAPPRIPTRQGGVSDAAMEATLDAIRRTMRTREYSGKTERSYIGWARRFLRHHAGAVDHPDRLNASHAAAFLEHLTLKEGLAARSRNQAAAALGFMFRVILGRDEMADIARARVPVMSQWSFHIGKCCAYSRNSGASSS